jgi:capsular exopolysaccharide synthesis family protein
MADPKTPTPRPASGPPHGLPPGFGGFQVEGDVHLLDRLGVVYRYRRIVITMLGLVMVGAVVQTYTTVPLYRAGARVQIEEERPAIQGFQDTQVYLDPEVYKNTQYSILRGRELARKVVRKLDLANNGAFLASRRQPSGLRAALGALRARTSAAVSAFLAKEPGPEPPAPNESAIESGLVNAFLGGVRIDPELGSQIVSVGYIFTDAQFAALAANALAESYVEQNLEAKQQTSRKTLLWLADQIAAQERKVQDSEQALATYREQHDALSLGDVNVVANRLNYFNDQAARAKSLRVQKETLYNQIRSLKADDPAADTFPAIAQNGSIQRIKIELQKYEQDRRDLSQRYGELHPDMKKLAGQIDDARVRLQGEVAKVVESVRQEYESALADERRLASAYAQAESDATELNRKSIDYSVLENQAKTNREIYQRLLQQQQEMQVAANSTENNVRLLDRAEVPGVPFTPNVPRNLLIALAVGLALGLGLAFSLDYLDDTVKTPEDITRKVNVPFLGLVPAVRGDRVPVLSGPVPHDFGEAYRALRTSLVFTSGAESTRVIAVTSAQPLEGKTTTACNLAIVLALGGARVLLVDADMRRPGVHKALHMQNGVGLSHLLVGQARVREAIQRTDDPNFYVMTAGRTPPNPSELLAGERMQRLVENLATGPFDWVVIDTPPVLAVTDAVVISPLVSGVVFVLGAEMTRRRLAERAVQMLSVGKPRVIGAVLNRVNFDRNKYYYSRYYGYQYKSYYGHGQAPAKA